jgi:hypothetical protein
MVGNPSIGPEEPAAIVGDGPIEGLRVIQDFSKILRAYAGAEPYISDLQRATTRPRIRAIFSFQSIYRA